MKRILLAAFLLSAVTVMAQKEVQKAIQTDFILAENGSTIQLPEGHFIIEGTLSIEGKNDIKIKGAGIGKTILDFKDQTEGAEGLRLSNMENVLLEGLSVRNAKGDAVKAMHVKNVHFKNVETSWDGKPKASNGAYGLYPVLCEGVIIESCTAKGASDAGIYVGQSKNIEVFNCKAIQNVAGIEIENSLNAEVHDNESTDNTGGVLVFDLPDLIQKKGGNVKVYDNYIHDNNYVNFAPKGNIVGKVPQGTGVLILATSDVEIYNNKIENNRSMGVGLISYYMTENPIKDEEYYPYPTKITIRDNAFSRQHRKATGKGRMGKMYRFVLKFGKDVPFVQWDGIHDPQNTDWVFCMKDNVNQSFVNMDAENNFKGMNRDLELYNCQ
ncbi:right-handed parallel beta-helix repeat-containing protein [Marinilongibacter aquaticus]|uniref:parallel beta-helix domain-containing protein n=1 Tax=Marinilongibacter aquaticus TaxID=2975157 RepID=UPI0021BDEB41|nr:parallel beta-helix domain-containing protein [Marinilongibacter aquaticus]UBM59269.1 right-handed parallel beta-helix repeat-containing protein [Marinilongibacter aquaticus]